VARLFANKMAFARSSEKFRTSGDAQLLNIATAGHARGQGVAFALMSAGLEYLRGQGVQELRLEVRPDNAPALAVYARAGCSEVGRTRDPVGEWIVMTVRP
jgi:ribosomal protein S18 acetylase RimI-like enzyme